MNEYFEKLETCAGIIDKSRIQGSLMVRRLAELRDARNRFAKFLAMPDRPDDKSRTEASARMQEIDWCFENIVEHIDCIEVWYGWNAAEGHEVCRIMIAKAGGEYLEVP